MKIFNKETQFICKNISILPNCQHRFDGNKCTGLSECYLMGLKNIVIIDNGK